MESPSAPVPGEATIKDLRAGAHTESHAIVLGTTALRESDRMVRFLTLEHGIISALAKGAARSQKRFGGALEPMSYVKAHLRVPRESAGEEAIWRLERVDLKDAYLHLRSSYAALENVSFVLRLVRDIIPEGSVDPGLFKALGRFLRDSAQIDLAAHSMWPRVAFWTWFTHHLGFGDLSSQLELAMRQADSRWVQLWHNCLALSEPDFRTFFHNLAQYPLPPLSNADEIRIYQRWVDLSGLHWEHFEKWNLATRNSH
jgi:hypothetical protein